MDLGKDIFEESKATLSIMDITRSVPYAQDMAGFTDMGRDRIIAGDLSLMRIISPLGSPYLETCRKDRSIYVKSKRAERKPFEHPGYNLRIEILETLESRDRETLQPSTHRTGTRKPSQSTESFKYGIAYQMQNMVKPFCPDKGQTQEQSQHTCNAKISCQSRMPHTGTDQAIQVYGTEIPDQELQPSVGCEVCFRELDTKISVDSAANFCFPSSHCLWPFVLVMVFV
jgi:hypothetical protein